MIAAVSFMASLLGCSNHNMVDGPGMVNDLSWKEFTLSRCDSIAHHNFSFTVCVSDEGFLLTGECRDQEGNLLTLEEGLRLSQADITYLRNLRLGDLEDARELPDDLEPIQDARQISLTVIYLDGTKQKKSLDSEITLEIYERLLPYFYEN